MKKSKVYTCSGLLALLYGCSWIHPGLGIATSGLLLLLLGYVEFVDEEEEKGE